MERKSQNILRYDAEHNSGLWNPNLVLTHGKGVKVYDADGNEYIDCLAGIAVASVGHANEHLANAIAKQAKRLIVCSQMHANDMRVAFYEKLMSFIPEDMGLKRIFMANSGSEVNEAALKWARATANRSKFVAAKRGFSGRTMGALSITWEKKYREPFEPLRYEADFIKFNSVEELDKAVTTETAAVFLEVIQGEGGIHVAEQGFLKAAREITQARGALLVIDEIQSGVGRTGKFLACEHFGVRPDMVTLAKGLGGGFPIGVLLMTEEVALSMPKGGHGTTFGGNALASAAALAVLEEIEAHNLIENAQRIGSYFKEQLVKFDSSKIRTVRGLGLMLAVELKEKVAPYINALKAEGVLAINAGATVIRFVPPLVISKDEVDKVLNCLDKVI